MKTMKKLIAEEGNVKIYNILAKESAEVKLCGSVYYTEGLEAHNHQEVMTFLKTQDDFALMGALKAVIASILEGNPLQEGKLDGITPFPMFVKKEYILDKEYMVLLCQLREFTDEQRENYLAYAESKDWGVNAEDYARYCKEVLGWTSDDYEIASSYLEFTKRNLAGEDLNQFLQPLRTDKYDRIKYRYIKEKYIPDDGKEITKASQIVTAVAILDYMWYQNGDVFEGSIPIGPGNNNISSYANWLDQNTDEAGAILNTCFKCKTYDDYYELLLKLCDIFLNEEYLSQCIIEDKAGSIYKCLGRFKYSQE